VPTSAYWIEEPTSLIVNTPDKDHLPLLSVVPPISVQESDWPGSTEGDGHRAHIFTTLFAGHEFKLTVHASPTLKVSLLGEIEYVQIDG
jgi:hypothetical protein